MNARILFAALLFAALPVMAAVPTTQTVDVVEFYNATLDHYFVTTDASEAADLDNGVHVGWKRTGLTFLAIKAGQAVAGSVPICRFYGSPSKGLDSHFYSASTAECTAVQAQFADSWLLESQEVFRAFPVDPNTGRCPASAESVFRLWNKRSDVNHRYTDQNTVYQQMIAKGYVAEGDGNPAQPVIFCMPMKDATVAANGTPACTLASSSSSPLLGSPVTLTATCTNNPTQFTWTNCVSTTNTCNANSSTAGLVTYSVVGTNATGAGNTAKADVTWTSSGGPVPICTITASTSTPTAGSGVTLTANCSQSPSSFAWMTCNYLLQSACNLIANCPAGSSTCTTNQSVPGLAHYALEATNSAGRGPRAGIDIDWGGSGGGGGGGGGTATVPVCNLYASSSTPQINSSVVLSASCSGNPTTYAWTNCTASGASCNTTATKAGAVTYSVVASNSAGNSAPATVQVSWQNPAPPSCTVTSSDNAPMAGTSVTLTANCSGSPTSYAWTNCTSSAATCVASNANAGAVTYTVAGLNASGTGAAAGVTVTWQPRPTAPPVCTVTPSSSSPFTGQTITLTASCTNAPTSYTWTNCVSSSSTCLATSSTSGTQSYSVQATNVVGTSTAASTSVVWQQSTTPPDFCGSYNNVVRTSLPWGGPTIYTRDFGPLRGDGVAVIAIFIPSTLTPPHYGGLNFAEYVDPQGARQVTLSRSPCDFSAPLLSVSLPASKGDIWFNLGSPRFGYPEAHVDAGQTYYVNIRTLGGCTGNCNMVIGPTWQ